jgi:predicted RNase H-like HicB family nuclease
MQLTVQIHHEAATFWSEVRELPGCFATGRTLAELDEALEDNIGLYLDDPSISLTHPPLRIGDVVVLTEPRSPAS